MDLPGAQFAVGQPSTTAKYAKPSERAARSMLAQLEAIGGQSANAGDQPNRKPKTVRKNLTIPVRRRGLEPPWELPR